MAKEKKAKGVKEEKKPTYSVEVSVNDTALKASGNDLHKIFLKFEFPAIIKTETNVEVTKGKKTVRKDLKVFDARKCFSGYDTTSLELLAIGIDKQLA